MSSVVQLVFTKKETTDPDTQSMIACKHCRNKTFKVLQDMTDQFPFLQCAACDAHIGHMGWVAN